MFALILSLFFNNRAIESTHISEMILTDCPETVNHAPKNSQNNVANAVETRCGWFHNPTPGNAWLQDRDREWIIGTQGGHQAAGGPWPRFSEEEWVNTNIHYGYGCACLEVIADHETGKILEIKSARSQPLKVCHQDPNLGSP